MIKIARTNSENPDFIKLVRLLDTDLKIRDGDEHAFYSQFNKIDDIKYVIVAYKDEVPLGCGAIKMYDIDTMEIKRMFVQPDSRGNGIASKILTELENWAKELNFSRCILETGVRQPEAIQLYIKNQYQKVPNFGQYINVANSVCFEKIL